MKKLYKWFVPMAFLILCLVCLFAVHGHKFLGMVCFGLAAVISCYYLIALLGKKHNAAAKILNILLTVLLSLGICIFSVTEAFVLSARAGDESTQFTYLLVLGAKVNGTAPSISLNDRLLAAYDYMAAHPDVIAVVTGGQGEDEGISEAQCMFNELTRRGISPDRIWLEEEATSTWENLQFSLRMIAEKTGERPETIGILSSEYHLFRAGWFADLSGVEAALIPARTSWPTIRLNYFMREVVGIWKFIILGG